MAFSGRKKKKKGMYVSWGKMLGHQNERTRNKNRIVYSSKGNRLFWGIREVKHRKNERFNLAYWIMCQEKNDLRETNRRQCRRKGEGNK